jgi:hypothetical protein
MITKVVKMINIANVNNGKNQAGKIFLYREILCIFTTNN